MSGVRLERVGFRLAWVGSISFKSSVACNTAVLVTF